MSRPSRTPAGCCWKPARSPRTNRPSAPRSALGTPGLTQQLEELIAAGVRAGEWPPGTDPALAARLFSGGLYGLMAQWHLAPGSFSWDAAVAVLAGAGS